MVCGDFAVMLKPKNDAMVINLLTPLLNQRNLASHYSSDRNDDI